MNYISSATTRKDLTVKCVFDVNIYEPSIWISNNLIESVDVERLDPNEDYAYIILKFKSVNNVTTLSFVPNKHRTDSNDQR